MKDDYLVGAKFVTIIAICLTLPSMCISLHIIRDKVVSIEAKQARP